MKPFKFVQTKNFGPLLFVARAMALTGYVFTSFSVVFVVWQLTKFHSLASISSLGLVFASLGIVVTAAVLAALVSIEENTRIRASGEPHQSEN